MDLRRNTPYQMTKKSYAILENSQDNATLEQWRN